jgi:hypothetical protein
VKHKNSDLPSYWILAVFGIVITAAIILYVKGFFDNTKRSTDDLIESTTGVVEEFSEYEITMYEDEELQGSQVRNYIKRNLGDYTTTETAPFYVRVKTVVSGTNYIHDYVNKVHIKDIKNVSAVEYFIKPTAYFYCEVIRSENKVILGISFSQK